MKKMLSYALCAGAVLATSSLAQDADYTPPPAIEPTGMTDPEPRMKDPHRPNLLADKVGMEVQVGGGVAGFFDNDASSIAKPGGEWTARLIVGTRSHIAGEAAYIGSAQNLDTLGVSDQAVLMSNGFEAALRVNVLTGAWQPYAIAGYTFRRYEVTNTAVNTSSVSEADNVSAIPLGVGLAWRFEHLVADLRVTFHGAFGRELIPDANLSTYSTAAKVGFEF